MRHWCDSLFARIFALQLVTAVFVGIIALFVVFQGQAGIFARATAPLWASAILPIVRDANASSLVSAPSSQTVSTTVSMLPGPPPPDASAVPWVPRYRALAAELRLLGVPVSQIKISGRGTGAATWLLLDLGSTYSWVGVRGELEGVDRRNRTAIGIAIAIPLFLLIAWWLSSRVAKPLAQLEAHVDEFEATGIAPLLISEAGPPEIRKLARRFNAFIAERAAQDQLRNIMLAGVSHDLRSPLGRIRAAAGLLPDAPGVVEKKETIVSNVRVADQLIGSFLALARATGEPLEDTVDITSLIQVVIDESCIDDVVIVTSTRSVPLLRNASRAGLDRAIRNILENAFKYGAPPFVFTLTADNDGVDLLLRDHGAGIAAEECESLLRPFFRGDSSRGQPGTGLGLAIVVETMKRHRGSVHVFNATPGLGVRLRFEWNAIAANNTS